MSTTPGWSATDQTNGFGNTIVWKDVDLDGYQELALSDNDQILNGSGDFKLYQNSGAGLATTPYWTDFGGQVSGHLAGSVGQCHFLQAFFGQHHAGHRQLLGPFCHGGCGHASDHAFGHLIGAQLPDLGAGRRQQV